MIIERMVEIERGGDFEGLSPRNKIHDLIILSPNKFLLIMILINIFIVLKGYI